MNNKILLFDLDGTITDSAEGIINSVIYALEKMSQPVPEKKELYSFIGPPLKESFETICQLNEVDAQRAVTYYREYYQKEGLYQNQVYQGIPELLIHLNELGYPLYIATSKPEVFAKEILVHFELTGYFKGIYGASLDGVRSKKADVIAYALKEAKLEMKKDVIMIGDRKHDILGGKENNLDTIGVLYGFGNREELQIAQATYLAATPNEIMEIVEK
ncbi:HAD family hydrolase [Enterococcus sp. LJL99]